MAQKSRTGKGANLGKGGIIVLTVSGVVIAALVGIVIYLVLAGRGSGGEETSQKRDVVVNEQNAEDVAADLVGEERTPVGYYQVTMNSTWNFASGNAVSDNAYVENATSNTNAVYFDVVRNDTGETVYGSPVIPVGAYLDQIRLDEKLDAGTYDCTLTYHLIDDDQKTLSTVNMALTIVIAK